VAAVAEETGQHPNTIREHLDALVDAGLVVREPSAAHGRGRPAWLYSAADVEEPDPRVRHYAALAVALAGQISRGSDHPGDDALAAGQEWGRSLAGSIGPQSAAGARRRTVELLAELGFEPRANTRATAVRLRQCPFLDAARRQPDIICTVHLGVVRGVLAEIAPNGPHAALEPFAEAGACVLRLGAPTGGDT
jgi:predicted ArsR family transcriptional regulator